MNACRMIGLALIAALASGGAHAQTLAPASLGGNTPLNLSDDHVSIGPPQPKATGGPAANRTSVDHVFGPRLVTASVGYLCGLQPPSDRTPGPASTFGPISTFLGAKLSYAFK